MRFWVKVPVALGSQVVLPMKSVSALPGTTVSANDMGAPKQSPNTGVAVMLAVCGALTAADVNDRSPAPEAGKPIAGLSFVHCTDAPGESEKARLIC